MGGEGRGERKGEGRGGRGEAERGGKEGAVIDRDENFLFQVLLNMMTCTHIHTATE